MAALFYLLFFLDTAVELCEQIFVLAESLLAPVAFSTVLHKEIHVHRRACVSAHLAVCIDPVLLESEEFDDPAVFVHDTVVVVDALVRLRPVQIGRASCRERV